MSVAYITDLLKQSRDLQWVDPYRSLDLADQAMEIAIALDYQKGIATSYNLRGFCFWAFGDNDLAIQASMEALAIGKHVNDENIMAESYYILARSYMDLTELDKSEEFIALAGTLVRQSQNAEQLCTIYNLQGVIKFIESQRDSALYFYKKAYDLGKQQGIHPIHFPRIISNIGECHFATDTTLAFSYFRQAEALAEETNNQIAKASIADIIGHAYLKTNKLNLAEERFQSALHLASQLGLRRVIRHAYAGMVDVKLKQGRGSEAVTYLRKYYAVRDSLLSTSRIRQVVEMETKLAMQVKEQEVKILESENRIRTIWNYLLLAFVLLITLMSITIYYIQQYRYRKNREMLNLEIDYLTREHQKTVASYKTTLRGEGAELLESYDQRLLRKVITLVETHISNPQFGVEKLAGEMNMSRTHLHRKIKSITGFPPNELIRSIRLRRAALLIVNKVDSITQIALMTGFDDYSYFSKAFKKHFGVSPSSYAEHNLQHVKG